MPTLDDALYQQLVLSGLPVPVREYRFHSTRLWRFDLAWVEQKLAVECEGGVYTEGRHVRGIGFVKDCEKYNHAVLEGWRVLRFTGETIESGYALWMIGEALK